MMGLVGLSVVGVGGITVYSQRKLLEIETIQHHEKLIQSLARVCEESLYQSNLVFTNYSQTLKEERGFLAAAFVDSNEMARFHSQPEAVDHKMIQPPEALSYSAPVQFAGQNVGRAVLFISKAAIRDFLNDSTRRDIKRIGFITLMVLIVGLLAVMVFTNRMIAPIQRIILGMREVSKGRLTAIDFPNRNDEIGRMGSELNMTIDKLKEVDELKRDFVAGVTHDLKSPLKAIQGFVTLLLNEGAKSSPEKSRDYLTTIQNNASRLMEFIDDLLTTARIESKRESLDLKLFDVRGSLQEIGQLFRAIAIESNVALDIEMPLKPVYVYADRDRVGQILNNLVSNAFKFTKKGSVSVRVKEGDAVAITVSDTGSGIPKEDRDKIFEKFYRSKSNAKQAKGTGLGLFIVQGLVEAQRGTIQVVDNPGGGTAFTFTLPTEE